MTIDDNMHIAKRRIIVRHLLRGIAAFSLPVMLSTTASAAGEIPPDSTVYLDEKVLVREPSDYALEEANDTVQTVVTADDSPTDLTGRRSSIRRPRVRCGCLHCFPVSVRSTTGVTGRLPIVVGGFMGLGYATSWNNNQLTEYTQAYRDLMDSDPATNSYMNFFPSTTKEEDLDKTWLANTMKSRRDFYRRNRDLCIICCVGLYLLCMIDAYVDASLAHFDISPDLSIEWSPAMIVNPSDRKVSAGLNWAFNF